MQFNHQEEVYMIILCLSYKLYKTWNDNRNNSIKQSFMYVWMKMYEIF